MRKMCLLAVCMAFVAGLGRGTTAQAGLLTTDNAQVWSQNSAGISDTAEAGDLFGGALATGDFNGDGYADLAIGAPWEDYGGVDVVGVVHIIYGGSPALTSTAQYFHQNFSGVADSVEAYDNFARSLAAGDFDNDGYDDLAIGVPFEDIDVIQDAGAVHVMYGSASGLSTTGDQFWNQSNGTILDIAEADDQFGWSLAAGDFDGDSYCDLAIGVPGENVSGYDGAGAVCVLFGSNGGLSTAGNELHHQDSVEVNSLAEAGDHFGKALAAGDFDGDGYCDLAVGAPDESHWGTEDGVVHVLYGGITGLLAGQNDFHHLGNGNASDYDEYGSVLCAGDFDGNGYDDIAVGIPFREAGATFNAGAVRILYCNQNGPNGAVQDWTTANLAGVLPGTSEYFGGAIAAGDFNADGIDDLAVGAYKEDIPSWSGAGVVYVGYGTILGITSDSTQRWHQDVTGVPSVARDNEDFGRCLAAGDFNADGGADLAIGVPNESISGNDAGAVNVLYGGSLVWAPWLPASASGWISVPWFGSIKISDHPWIYHAQHGWMFTVGDNANELWFFSLDMGWLFTGQTLYPNMYWLDGGTWLYYLRDSTSPRWFYNWNAGFWQAVW